MKTDRREFAAMLPGLALAPPARKDVISLAAWSLYRSFFQAKRWTNLDLPRITREEFGITALEFVNQFFDNPMLTSLQKLKRAGTDHGVKFVRIMVDNEGNMAAEDKNERMLSAGAHRKWVDIAHYLGCSDIRCNIRGGPKDWKQDKDFAKRGAEAFRDLLDYSKGSGLDIVIENHGGASSDADLLASVMKLVNDPRFGTLPDFGNVNPGDDHYAVIRKLMPWAKGVSVKGMWASDGSHPAYDIAKMCRMCLDMGFHGYWGIESSFGLWGRDRNSQPPVNEAWAHECEGVRKTKAVLDSLLPK